MTMSCTKEELSLLRTLAQKGSISDLLNNQCSEELLKSVCGLTERTIKNGKLYFGCLTTPLICKRFSGTEDLWEKVRTFCVIHFEDDIVFSYALPEVLVLVFQPSNVGAWIDKGVVRKIEPDLNFDKDGLLYGSSKEFQFVKEGILTNKYFIPYDHRIPGAGKTDGFVERILFSSNTEDVRFLGLSIEQDAVLEKCYHIPLLTKAYIWGPKGIDEEILCSADFPEDKSGTLTVHQYADRSNVYYQLFPVERLEIMWSQKGELKSVQIEELVNTSNLRQAKAGLVSNRYVHAQWSTSQHRVIHFDGATRVYELGEYQKRLQSTLKNKDFQITKYKKLFRIDGSLPLDIWKNLLAAFFEGNLLIGEYLGGPDKECMFEL